MQSFFLLIWGIFFLYVSIQGLGLTFECCSVIWSLFHNCNCLALVKALCKFPSPCSLRMTFTMWITKVSVRSMFLTSMRNLSLYTYFNSLLTFSILSFRNSAKYSVSSKLYRCKKELQLGLSSLFPTIS